MDENPYESPPEVEDANVLNGGFGNDTLNGGGGTDHASGRDGTDTCTSSEIRHSCELV